MLSGERARVQARYQKLAALPAFTVAAVVEPDSLAVTASEICLNLSVVQTSPFATFVRHSDS